MTTLRHIGSDASDACVVAWRAGLITMAEDPRRLEVHPQDQLKALLQRSVFSAITSKLETGVLPAPQKPACAPTNATWA